MAWALRWPLWRRDQGGQGQVSGGRLTLTVGNAPDVRLVALSTRDVWQLRNGFMILRDGLLVVPEAGKLRFLQADSTGEVERKLLGEIDAAALKGIRG